MKRWLEHVDLKCADDLVKRCPEFAVNEKNGSGELAWVCEL